jgi:hypothetical protein
MARKASVDKLVGQLAEHISGGVAKSLQSFLSREFDRLARQVARAGSRADGARGRGRAARVAQPPEAMERKRSRILSIVKRQSEGIKSKDVALRMKVDARGVGKLLARMHKERRVKKDGDLYFPA